MSMKTWKKEYYPITAAQAARRGTLAACLHSLQKWEGLRGKNLKRHGLIREGQWIRSTEDHDVLEIDNHSCALCELVFKHAQEGTGCSTCPLYIVRQVPCGSRLTRERTSPYFLFTDYGYPRPMIRWLEKAVAWAKERAAHGKAKP